MMLRTMLIEKAAKYTKLTTTEKGYVGLCPFHKEKTPSFTINKKGDKFCCFGCGSKGDYMSFCLKIDKDKNNKV